MRARWSGTPQEAPVVAAELEVRLMAMRAGQGVPLEHHQVCGAMSELAGARCWDAMPVAACVGAFRLVWRGPDVAEARYLLVTDDGACFVEGTLPQDARRAATYLDVRRRYLAAHPAPEIPLPGSPEGLAASAAYDALVERLAEVIADLGPGPRVAKPVRH